MTKWMSGAVVLLALLSISSMQGRPAASAASQSAETCDPLAGEAAARHRQCLPNHWRSLALQPGF
jgi:hypothetical protein